MSRSNDHTPRWREIALPLALVGPLSGAAIAQVVPPPKPLVAGPDQRPEALLHVGLGDRGGRLAIDLHADLMVARGEDGVVRNWNNCGTFKWSLGRFGFDGPRGSYPRFEEDLSGTPALTFSGSQRLRLIAEGDASLPPGLCDDELTIELWLYAESTAPRARVLRWGPEDGQALLAGDFKLKRRRWTHCVAVSKAGRTQFYRDGRKLSSRERPLDLAPDSLLDLGAESFQGGVAALRVHTEPLNPRGVRHNSDGGPRLGSQLFQLIHGRKRADMNLGDPRVRPEDREWRESKHFRSMWIPSKNPDPDDDIAARVEDVQLPGGEEAYDWMAHRLALHMPIVSAREELRGDGRKYKIVHGNKWTGGDVMGFASDIGFGWGMTYAGYFNSHELLHGVQAHQMGRLTGHWWESHANFGPSFAGSPKVNPVEKYRWTGAMFPSSGSDYYHAYLIWEHLALNPEYGPRYSTWLWNMRASDEELFPPRAMARLDPDPSTPFEDEWVRLAARNLTWDYPDRPQYAKRFERSPYPERTHLTLLRPVPERGPGWFEPPSWRAPQQHGYNLLPLKRSDDDVRVTLEGWVDPERGSDWRAMLVAIRSDGSPRYGEIFGPSAPTTHRARPDDRELFLVVAATPTKVLDIGIFQSDERSDYRAPAQDRFPYAVKLEGALPDAERWSNSAGRRSERHRNGGGLVAGTAEVSPEAWVGPNARVLGSARVLGDARVEGGAVVSGYAIVEPGAVVADRARVGDHALIESGARVQGRARILEHATVKRSASVGQLAVCKGMAHVGGAVRGTAVVDGNYNKSNSLDRGWWFSWSWGTGQNPGELDVDTGGLFLEYLFEQPRAWRVHDTYGASWGRLLGTGEYREAPGGQGLELGAAAVRLPDSAGVQDDVTLTAVVNWRGGARGQRLWSFDGAEDASLWLSPADEGGVLALHVEDSNGRRAVRAQRSLPADRWVAVQWIQSGREARLRVDDELWAISDEFDASLAELQVNDATLGGREARTRFQGAVDRFALHSKALVEDVPPRPDPLTLAYPVAALDGQSALIECAPASDPNGPVEYRFQFRDRARSIRDTGWQEASNVLVGGLPTGRGAQLEVRARDALGNVTRPLKVRIPRPPNDRTYFEANDAGEFVIEAEAFHASTVGQRFDDAWEVVREPAGLSAEAGVVVANRGRQIDRDYAPDASPRLDYRVRFERAGTYRLHLRGIGPTPGDNSCHAGLDRQELESLNLAANFDPRVGPHWKRSRTFEVPSPGVHEINLWMREDGTLVDKLVLQPVGADLNLTPPEGRLQTASREGRTSKPIATPSAPSELRAKLAQGEVRLSWAPVPNVVAYRVYRQRSDDDDSRVCVSDEWLKTTQWVDRPARTGIEYSYRVSVLIADHVEGQESPPLDVVVPFDAPPESRANPVATSRAGSLQLTWEPAAEEDVVGYRLWRSASGGRFERLNSEPWVETKYIDDDLDARKTYAYRV
ncbi:MAG: DUF6055 domain-containing protein, partial [Planctomycetota bacterium]